MSTATFHVIGSAHEARFAENFDELLGVAVNGASDPERAESELDELALLSVLSHFVAAGEYDPARPVPAWGLQLDQEDRRIRRHRYGIYASDHV